MESFFSEGVSFSQAFSSASWTLPSLVSLMSSEYPFEHGISRGEFKQDHGGLVLQPGIPTNIPWLAEILQKAGFHTFGFSTSPHTIRGTGFEKGFDHFEAKLAFQEAKVLNQHVLSLSNEIRKSGPFFLWLHYFDPHWQYLPKSPWIERYAPRTPPLPKNLYDLWLHSLVEEGGIKLHDPLFDYLLASYDSEINYWDTQVSNLLKAMDFPPNTILILTADHGEGFLEHGLMDHGNSLYEELIHVPLMIRWAAAEFRVKRINTAASLVDIAPTLLGLLNLPADARFRGHDWTPTLLGGRPQSRRRVVYSQLSNGPVVLDAALTADWKCIVDETTGRILVFDRKKDQLEKHPLLHGDQVLQTRRFLAAFAAAKKSYPPRTKPAKARVIPIDKKTEAELRALGYVQ